MERLTSYFTGNDDATLASYHATRRALGKIFVLGATTVTLGMAQTLATPSNGDHDQMDLIHEMIDHLSARIARKDQLHGNDLVPMMETAYWGSQLKDPSKADQAVDLLKNAADAMTQQSIAIGLNRVPLPVEFPLYFVGQQLRAKNIISQMRRSSSPEEQWSFFVENLLRALFIEQKGVTGIVQVARQQQRRFGQPLMPPPSNFLLWPILEEAMSVLHITPDNKIQLEHFRNLLLRSYGNSPSDQNREPLTSDALGMINLLLKKHGYILTVEGIEAPQSVIYLSPMLYKLRLPSKSIFVVDKQPVETFDADPVRGWTPINLINPSAIPGAFNAPGLPQTLVFLPQSNKAHAEIIRNIRLAPDAESTRAFLENWHPVVKRIIDLSFPDPNAIETILRRFILLYHELLHFWQRTQNHPDPDILAHFQQIVDGPSAARDMTMEFAAHMGTLARSDAPYWHLLEWSQGLSETGDVRAADRMGFIDDWLVKQLVLELRSLVETKENGASHWKEMDAILKSPLPFLSQYQGRSILQHLLDAGITPQELRDVAEAYHVRLFGPLMPMSVLRADASRRNLQGTRFAWVRGFKGIAAALLFALVPSHTFVNSSALRGLPSLLKFNRPYLMAAA